MPRFGQSQAAQVDTSLPSNPIISATDLEASGTTIQMFDKRVAKTQFGMAIFVDFEYADDDYTEEGTREHQYTTVFSENSPAYKQLKDEELNYADPLEAKVVKAGRSFKLADPYEEVPTPAQASAPAQPASTARAAAPSGRAAVPAGQPAARQRPQRPTGTEPVEDENIPF